MANMTFGVNILPSANNTYTLGNSDNKWTIYAQDATSSNDGLMSSTDKSKLDDMAVGTLTEFKTYLGIS